jgi:Sulfotransferase family
VTPPPFVFVLGCGRSGTSVLRTVLDAHPDLAVAWEGRFVAPLGLRRARYERPEGFDTDRLLADLLADRAVRTNLELGEADLRAALVDPGPGPADFPDAVRRVFAHWAAARGKARYGDKFPGYVLRMDLLAGMFPEGRFVHIVRDGRDVALSSMAIEPDDAVTLALNWRSRVTTGRDAGARLGDARYQEVRYESLVTDPEPVVEGLCDFLDLPYDPAMLAFPGREGGVPGKLTANPRHARLAEPLSPGTRSWRRDMDPADVAAFEAVAGDLLEECGYDRATDRPSAAARARAAWGRTRWQLTRASARLPGAARRAVGR